MNTQNPEPADLEEMSRVFAALDAIGIGAVKFAETLVEVDPVFAEALAGCIERNFALKNPVDNLVFTQEKIPNKINDLAQG